ncbi:MAG: flagellar biosynthesis anti-sigma factor FlgM [Desulfobacula sp.]|nr:flagellar biosynthesis anti-sigma factor FlgM [Desulfobacula sp.]
MKISNATPNYINQTYTNQSKPAANRNLKSQTPLEETQTDSINLSSKTRDLQKISKALETEPSNRQQYVADIKQKVENNQYDINAESIANKMVGILVNELG